MLLGARTVAWGGGGEPKPYDAELQWIMSSPVFYSPAYFDMGIKGNTNLSFTVDAELSEDSAYAYGYLFGCGDGNNVREVGVWIHEKTVGCRFTGSSFGNISYTGFEVNAELSKTLFRVNENSSTSSTYGEWENSQNLIVLGLNRNGVINGTNTKTKLKNLSIYENGVLIRDVIPVRVGDVGYLYDRANPTGGILGNGLYAKMGNGTLTNGPDKT